MASTIIWYADINDWSVNPNGQINMVTRQGATIVWKIHVSGTNVLDVVGILTASGSDSALKSRLYQRYDAKASAQLGFMDVISNFVKDIGSVSL